MDGDRPRLSRWLRPRLPFLALAAVTIGVGLGVYQSGRLLPPTLRDVLGDTLWAAMVFWWTGVAAPAASVRARAIGSLLFTYAVELSQLYHSPALDALRRTTPGHLILGSGFDGRDLVAYALGVGAAALFNWLLARRSRLLTTPPEA